MGLKSGSANKQEHQLLLHQWGSWRLPVSSSSRGSCTTVSTCTVPTTTCTHSYTRVYMQTQQQHLFTSYWWSVLRSLCLESSSCTFSVLLLILFSLNGTKITFIYFCVCMCHSEDTVWRSENNLQEFILSFHYTGPRDWTQVARLDSQCLYPMRCFTDTNGDSNCLKCLLKALHAEVGLINTGFTKVIGFDHTVGKSFSISSLGLLFLWVGQILGSRMKMTGQSLSSNLITSEKKNPYLQQHLPTESKPMLSSEDTLYSSIGKKAYTAAMLLKELTNL